ncbi:MAG: Uma2 family endonuclease [Cyanobacteria bacterium J06636_16]
MIGTLPLISHPIPQPIGERHVVFHYLNWQRYQAIRHALSESRNICLTYTQGILEITRPLEDPEFAVRLIELFIRVLVVESGMKLKTMGSTTLERAILDRASEPDNAYYIQNQPLVAGRNVDLEKDPPPDLIVEIDITHTDIDKLKLYAGMGIPEFWRYNGETWQIYQLQGNAYQEVDSSPTFLAVPKSQLFLAQAKQDEVEAELSLRAWVRSQFPKQS